MLNRLNKILFEHNNVNFITRLFAFFYKNTIRKVLPTIDYVKYSGLDVKPIKFLDEHLKPVWKNYDKIEKPNYEFAILKGLRNNVKKDDHVVIVGGGHGVTTVTASKLVGNNGKITCYEASKKSIKQIFKTISYNQCPKNISVINECIGNPISVWGGNDVEVSTAVELPDCDILELDCEGSEKEILMNLKIRPRLIIVESHGKYNSPTQEIVTILQRLKYDPVKIEIAEIDEEENCIKNDIRVITAHRL